MRTSPDRMNLTLSLLQCHYRTMERTWTITELAGEAAAVLAADPAAPADQVNGRVRDTPNERLIRWYTTIGLVDPPLARRGRTARYGQRHLLQIVAVKRRQAAGLSIAEIQAELAGAPHDVPRAVPRLPRGRAGPPTHPGAGGPRRRPADDRPAARRRRGLPYRPGRGCPPGPFLGRAGRPGRRRPPRRPGPGPRPGPRRDTPRESHRTARCGVRHGAARGG